MVKDKCNVDPSKYVVLDVETNGLSSNKDDLLSISIYKPDTGETFNRFLPLELNPEVVTTQYNGIETKDLKGLVPLSQEEVDRIIRVFDLKNRTILTYGSIDEKFIVKYFLRHDLQGIDFFSFYNFKHEIISSSYSEGNITKDNLCNLYGINNVQTVHSGSNDCILEWKLFERMNGHRLLVTDNKVFEFNDKYIVPASFITTYPNLKYYIPDLPKISCESNVVYSLPVSGENLKKFPTNFNGVIIEHLINSMLDVKKIHSERELLENKKTLKYLGVLPSKINLVPMILNPDGSMTATRPQDKKIEKEINATIRTLQILFEPLIDFIGNSIFEGKTIKSQELIKNTERKVLALCDLSNENAVLEIKATASNNVQNYADQLYYEANGRKCYILFTDWSKYPEKISYDIHKVKFSVTEYDDPVRARYENARDKIETDEIELVNYYNNNSPVKLRCKKCGNEWSLSYYLAKKHRPCPYCAPTEVTNKDERKKPALSEEEYFSIEEQRKIKSFFRYRSKLEERSNHQLYIISFTDSRSPVRVRCLSCGREWEYRADHLLERPYCTACRKRK